MPSTRHASVLCSAAGLCLGVSTNLSQAQTLNWNNAAGGAAATAANWNPAQIPTGANDLVFNLVGTYAVNWSAAVPSSRTQTYRRGTVTNTFTAAHTASLGITIGDLNGDNATVTLTTGTWTSNATVTIGDAAGSSGHLNINDDDADLVVTGATSDFFVGSNGAATLSITGGGLAQVADSLIAGNNASSIVTLNVSGMTTLFPQVRSTLDVLGASSSSRLGQGGDATATVSNGALARFAGSVVVANGSASTSSVSVAGTGGILNNVRATLDVGGDFLVGANEGAPAAGAGACTVDDSGLLLVGGTLHLGDDPAGGTGSLTIGTDATVDTNSLIIGANGTLTHGAGTLRINGGTFTGHADPLVITGTGAPTLQFSSGLSKTISPAGAVGVIVGNDTGAGTFTGTLLIDSGADLILSGNSKDINLGDDAGTTGTLRVAGAGSRLVASSPGDDLRVGFNGSGLVQITDAGTVQARNVLVPALPAGQGSVGIAGDGSSLTTSTIAIGHDSGGTGIVEVASGGSLIATEPGIGVLVRATGTLIVVQQSSVQASGTILLDAGRLDVHGSVSADLVDVDAGGVLSAALNTGGVPTVTARTRVRAGAELNVEFDDLTIGDATAADGFIADDLSVVHIFKGRTLTVHDLDRAVFDEVSLDNANIVAPHGIEIVTPGTNGRLTGSGTITAPEVFFESGGGVITATGDGITINGLLRNNSGNCDGSRFTFNQGPQGTIGGWHGAGALVARVAFNDHTSIDAHANMTMGVPALDGVVLGSGSELHANDEVVTLVDSNGLTLAGVTDLIGGHIVCSQPLLVGPGRRLSGRDGSVDTPLLRSFGTIAPGNLEGAVPLPETGRLTINGSLLMQPNAAVEIQLGGFQPPLEFDRLVVNGTAQLDGDISVSLVRGFLPPPGSRFIIMQFTSSIGQFTTQHLPPGWHLFMHPGFIEVVNGCRADFNHDGVVNSQDFFDYIVAFFSVVHEGGGPADFNLDGFTNSQDFFDFLVTFFNGC